MITTTHGDMDEAMVHRNVPETVDNENELTTAIEYWMERNDECAEPGHDITVRGLDGVWFERVHRSVHVTLKRWPAGAGAAGYFGGAA